MPNGGLPNCLQCKHSKKSKCNIFGIETSPYLLCRHYRDEHGDKTFDEHITPYLEPLAIGTVFWIGNAYGATEDNPTPAFTMVKVKNQNLLI